jgi:Flp pilus assembly protein TadD
VEARAEIREVERLAPGYSRSAAQEAEIDALEGNWEGAVRHLRRAVEQNPSENWFRGALSLALFRAGQREEALGLRKRLEEEGAQPLVLAHAYTGEDRFGDAVRQLEIALQQRDKSLVTIGVEPLLRDLHSLPEFRRLLAEMRLTPQ